MKLYYIPPTDEQFNELKDTCIKLWRTKDDTYGYVSEKISMVNKLNNTGDNFMYIITMFDTENQMKLSKMLSKEIKNCIYERLESVNNTERFIYFKP